MPRLDLGMPTLLELPAFADCAALCASLGLRFVELSMNLPQYQPGTLDEAALRRAMDAHGVYCTLHLDETFAPCDFNPLVRGAHLQTMAAAIALARRLGMPIVNMHLPDGVYFSLPGRRVYLLSQYRAHYLQSLKALRTLCEGAVGGADIRVCVENCGGFPDYAREGVELLLESPVFGLTLDVGHAHCAGEADAPLYARHAGRLAHMHLHDAAGRECHLPLGEGALPLGALLDTARQGQIRAVVEVKDVAGLRKSAAWLQRGA